MDFNGDGRPALVAQVVRPVFCGTGGCPLLISREAQPGRPQLVTQMSLFRDPVIVTERRENGWKELITRVRVAAGTGTSAELPYDGRTDRPNPGLEPDSPCADQNPAPPQLMRPQPMG